MTMNSVCPKCNFHNPAGARFCGNCGQTLKPSTGANASTTAETVCPQCGHQNDAGARFCRSCGQALVIEEEKRRSRWWLWLLILLGLIIGGTAVAVFVWPGINSTPPEEQPTAVANEIDNKEEIPAEEIKPAQEEAVPEKAPTATITADGTVDTPEEAADELPIATLPPPLANVEIPVEPVAYPDEWPADLRFPEQFSVVETESGPMPGDASAGWAAKYRFAGDPKSAADSLSSFFETNGWQIVEKEELDAGGFVFLLDKESESQTGIIVIDPDPNQAGHTIVVANTVRVVEETSTGDAEHGKELYEQTVIGANSAPGCITCHSLEPDTVLVGPSHAGLANRAGSYWAGMSAEEYLRESITDPDAHLAEGFTGGVMYQNYGDELSSREINDLVAFMLTLHSTEIVTFNPSGISGSKEEGSCWTSSIVANRPDAWRCNSSGQGIQDPCFSIAGDDSAVICGASPMGDGTGYKMNLTEPLPAPSYSDRDDSWWILELADGKYCTQIQGTALEVDGKLIHVTCGVEYMEDLIINDEVWIVRFGDYSDDPSPAGQNQMFVRRVWR